MGMHAVTFDGKRNHRAKNDKSETVQLLDAASIHPSRFARASFVEGSQLTTSRAHDVGVECQS